MTPQFYPGLTALFGLVILFAVSAKLTHDGVSRGMKISLALATIAIIALGINQFLFLPWRLWIVLFAVIWLLLLILFMSRSRAKTPRQTPVKNTPPKTTRSEQWPPKKTAAKFAQPKNKTKTKPESKEDPKTSKPKSITQETKRPAAQTLSAPGFGRLVLSILLLVPGLYVMSTSHTNFGPELLICGAFLSLLLSYGRGWKLNGLTVIVLILAISASWGFLYASFGALRPNTSWTGLSALMGGIFGLIFGVLHKLTKSSAFVFARRLRLPLIIWGLALAAAFGITATQGDVFTLRLSLMATAALSAFIIALLVMAFIRSRKLRHAPALVVICIASILWIPQESAAQNLAESCAQQADAGQCSCLVKAMANTLSSSHQSYHETLYGYILDTGRSDISALIYMRRQFPDMPPTDVAEFFKNWGESFQAVSPSCPPSSLSAPQTQKRPSREDFSPSIKMPNLFNAGQIMGDIKVLGFAPAMMQIIGGAGEPINANTTAQRDMYSAMAIILALLSILAAIAQTFPRKPKT